MIAADPTLNIYRHTLPIWSAALEIVGQILQITTESHRIKLFQAAAPQYNPHLMWLEFESILNKWLEGSNSWSGAFHLQEIHRDQFVVVLILDVQIVAISTNHANKPIWIKHLTKASSFLVSMKVYGSKIWNLYFYTYTVVESKDLTLHRANGEKLP